MKSGLRYLALVLVGFISACGGGSDNTEGLPNLAATLPIASYVAGGGATNAGFVDAFDAQGTAITSFATGNNQGLEVTASGHLAQAGHPAMGVDMGSIRIFQSPRRRFSGAGFDPRRDRQIGGPGSVQAALSRPKGMAIAQAAGVILVADNGRSRAAAYGIAAAGDQAPLGVVDLPAPPWDLAYDAVGDRLFVALTNGTVAVVDGYQAAGFAAAAPDRIVTPADAMGQPLSVNLHGIVHLPASDQLVVTDVGSAAVATDGQIFVLNGIAAANGNLVPTRRIGGPLSMLGNPVDCILVGSTLRVAEKSNGAILEFDSITSGSSGDIPPSRVTASIAPESVLLASFQDTIGEPDVTDLDDGMVILDAVLVASNPGAGQPLTGIVRILAADLGSELATFNVGASLENLVLDRDGDGFVTADDGSNQNGTVEVIGRLGRSRDGGAFQSTLDRRIAGGQTGLISPKGLDVDSERGLIFVTDNAAAAPAIRVFSNQSSGDITPLYQTDLTAFGRPWDLDYDRRFDRLYVAMTNGTCLVFDFYHSQLGQMPPSRIITPSMDGMNASSVNLHGIIHDFATDQLILSDVGSAAQNDDGAIFVIPNARAADGLTMPSVTIRGPATQLGNPVDLAWNGSQLFVAEKANNVILRFDSLQGGDQAPSATFPTAGPESLCLLPRHTGALPR
ncbi:MAG: hypothetical protein KDB53_21585 [Planctomycetes bacterium]|nr:hypothetical protein [Planctomycetota bacterium]